MSVILVQYRTTEDHMNPIIPILIFTALVLALDLAAITFGADSRDRIGSPSGGHLR